MRYERVALIGAGAVGAYFVYGFTNLEEVSFCVVAEGERRERLIREGITINDVPYHPEIKMPEEVKGADLVLVCTKYQHLDEAIDMVEKIVEEHTVVLSLLNGIDSEERIGQRIGEEHMLYSVMRISSERRNGQIRFVPETTIGVSVGEKAGGASSERVQAFVDLMKRGGLKPIPCENIVLDQWKKYSMNIVYNVPQAILGVGYGAYYDSRNVGTIRDRMYEEVTAVAKAEGIDIGPQADWRGVCAWKARFSTLQDIDAGRKTEIGMFEGPLLRLAEKHDIAVPYCEFAFMALKALEEKGEGKFDYEN